MAGKSTAFALIGDRYHNSDYIRTALGKTLGRELGLTIDFSDEVTLLNADTLQGYKLLILFRDAMQWPNGYDATQPAGVISVPPLPDVERVVVNWMTPEQGQAVQEFVMGGGSALLYHNVTYIAAVNPAFRDVLGAATEGHPRCAPLRCRSPIPTIPLHRG